MFAQRCQLTPVNIVQPLGEYRRNSEVIKLRLWKSLRIRLRDFLWKDDVKPSEIIQWLHEVFDVSAESNSTVYRWVNRFKPVRVTLENNLCSGWPNTAVHDINIATVKKLLMEDKRITIRETSTQVWYWYAAGSWNSALLFRNEQGFKSFVAPTVGNGTKIVQRWHLSLTSRAASSLWRHVLPSNNNNRRNTSIRNQKFNLSNGANWKDIAWSTSSSFCW